ncbi:hypothetical protein RUM44_013975 [Polyplax serrata]|uniref:Protein stoned-B-like n=1 Tax=Polyplax serrata TaxID=468196 RepID=A0ABR1BJR0_POLSC
MDDATEYGAPPQSNGVSSNPFLTSDFSTEPTTGTENLFLAGSYGDTLESLPETNPFASFATDYTEPNYQGQVDSWQQNAEPEYLEQYPEETYQSNEVMLSEVQKSRAGESETRPNELGLLTTTRDNDNDFLLSSDEELSKPKRPPPPHLTMPKETQDLILSVTGALEATSHHLLDRLPPTRAPSPTAFPDFQSLSPTPDTFIDLLGTPQIEPMPPNLPQFPSSEEIGGVVKEEKVLPPPRPPPARPAPPKPAPPAHVPKVQQQQDADMFDLFGTSKPPPPKTKDAILNLYSQPKAPPKDLLTDDLDILENEIQVTTAGNLDVTQLSKQETESQPKVPSETTIVSEPQSTDGKPEPVETRQELCEEQQKPEFNSQSNIFGVPEPEPEVLEKDPEITESHVLNAVEEEPHYIFGTKPSKPDIPTEQECVQIQQDQPPFVPEITSAEPRRPVMETKQSFDAFDAFAAKFESTGTGSGRGDGFFDAFSGERKTETNAWGSAQATDAGQQGFGTEDTFDAFLSMSQPPCGPPSVPSRLNKTESGESEDGGFNVFIKPCEGEFQSSHEGALPVLAPPPRSIEATTAFNDTVSRFNPFDKGDFSSFPATEGVQMSQSEPYEGGFKRSESQETPPTPLFDEDVSQPLEDFPRIHYAGDGWEMQLRQPNKKKITGQRFWKKIFVKLVYQGDNPVLQLFNLKEDKDPFQELPLQACYSVSDISAQQYDQFGKIFTVKLQYIFYKERPGVRPGQVTKAERITNKLSQFAAYAIQGDYQGVKEFGSDLRKLGLPVEHAPQISQLLKLGCMSYEDLKQFSVTLEECLFRMPVHRDRALNYKMEEVQITVVDEIYVDQKASGHVEKQIARVRLFFLGFLSGMPDVELGLNDMWRQGKEVVGRHDIIPVVTEEWIRLEAVEFHSCIQQEEYEKTRTIKFKPPDACYIELMRFRIRPPRNRELPLQLKAVMCITGNKVELRADVLVPGFTSRKLGQIPCEDVMIRFPIPECWIYLFRVEKHFRYGSVKSAHRRTGKIKGIERFLGAVDTLEPSLMEVTSGQAKYEHQHRSIVWRMPRLPKEGQGAYTTHNLVCRMQLTSFDQIPDNLAEYAYVEFTMPATQASHTTVRSVSLCDSPSDNPPEKYVRQLARHEYRVGIEHVHTEETAAYEAATIVKSKVPETVPEVSQPPPVHDSDSDSSD